MKLACMHSHMHQIMMYACTEVGSWLLCTLIPHCHGNGLSCLTDTITNCFTVHKYGNIYLETGP